MLDYYRREIETLISDLDQVVEHFANREILAALGAWATVEKRLPLMGAALTVIAAIYPQRVNESNKPTNKEDKQYGNKETGKPKSARNKRGR